jgi:hypothetical protein
MRVRLARDGQSFGGGCRGEGLADQIQQHVADHGIGLQGAERAGAVAKADEPFQAVLQVRIHGVGAFEQAKIGMVFGQRFIDCAGPEEEEERLCFGTGQADREAAVAVDEKVLGIVEGNGFIVERKAAGSGKHRKDAGAGDMWGAGIWFFDGTGK